MLFKTVFFHIIHNSYTTLRILGICFIRIGLGEYGNCFVRETALLFLLQM